LINLGFTFLNEEEVNMRLIVGLLAFVALPSWAANPGSWAGFYLGGHLGVTRAESSLVIPNYLPSGYGSFDINSDSFTYGAQLGYNYQFQNNFLLGIEYDYSRLSHNGTNPTGLTGETFHVHSNRQESISVRGGYSFGSYLGYIKVGEAYTRLDELYFSGPFGTQAGNYSGTLYGLGLDYRVSNNWTAGIEYTYVDFGTKRFVYAGPVDITQKNQSWLIKASYLF
jgi:outer membrane immunogenic protein